MAGSIFSRSITTNPAPLLRQFGLLSPIMIAGAAIVILNVLEFIQRDKGFALQMESRPLATRWAAYVCVVGLILCLRYTGSALDFIYFQF
jgi:hypothetical protein